MNKRLIIASLLSFFAANVQAKQYPLSNRSKFNVTWKAGLSASGIAVLHGIAASCLSYQSFYLSDIPGKILTGKLRPDDFPLTDKYFYEFHPTLSKFLLFPTAILLCLTYAWAHDSVPESKFNNAIKTNFPIHVYEMANAKDLNELTSIMDEVYVRHMQPRIQGYEVLLSVLDDLDRVVEQIRGARNCKWVVEELKVDADIHLAKIRELRSKIYNAGILIKTDPEWQAMLTAHYSKIAADNAIAAKRAAEDAAFHARMSNLNSLATHSACCKR